MGGLRRSFPSEFRRERLISAPWLRVVDNQRFPR